MRYLTRPQAASNLRVGKSVEQYLGRKRVGGVDTVQWVTVGRGEEGAFVVTLYRGRAPESADEELHDVYHLWALALDQDRALQPVDAAGEEHLFDDEEAAIAFVASDLGGSPERFVNVGFVTDDYNEQTRAGLP
jgi:hypothetical protein